MAQAVLVRVELPAALDIVAEVLAAVSERFPDAMLVVDGLDWREGMLTLRIPELT